MYDVLSQARMLIIDDFSQFRLTFKAMLYKLGAQQVDQAVNGSEAIKRCMENDYDIIFCDYNLGEGQDGQQILEELHQRSILLKGTLFLMVTAETTAAQVMGAIEYRPDAYLTKPFTNEQLAQRLNRLLKKNETLKGIHDAMNNGKLNQALQLCDEVITQFPTTRFSCLRLKSEILEQQKKYDDAHALYTQVIQEQPLLWAVLGIGRIYFNQGDTNKALEHFQQMQQDFPQQVSVYDWIARCYQALGELDNAESNLQQAIEISPKSVSRQATLGELAQSLNQFEVAQKAFEKTIVEGQYSCLLKPQHYQLYYDNTREVATELSEREQKQLLARTEDITKRMERKYQADPSAMASNLSSLATLYSSVGKSDQSSNFLSRLSKTLEKPECRISEKELAYIEQNVQTVAEQGSNNNQIEQLNTRMAVKREEIKQQMENEESARLINREGLNLAKQGQSQQALQKFSQAASLAPQNPNYALNSAQVILLNDDLKSDPEHLSEARAYLGSVSLENSGKRWRLYKKLMGYLPDE